MMAAVNLIPATTWNPDGQDIVAGTIAITIAGLREGEVRCGCLISATI